MLGSACSIIRDRLLSEAFLNSSEDLPGVTNNRARLIEADGSKGKRTYQAPRCQAVPPSPMPTTLTAGGYSKRLRARLPT